MTFALDRNERDVMRDMTPDELNAWYDDHQCPACKWPAWEFELGPRGGLSINIACPRCDLRLNVMASDRYAGVRFGQVIRESRGAWR